MKELEATEVAARLRPDDGSAPVLLDVREAFELEIASVDGAVHMPMQSVPSRVAELDPQRPVIVMCHHGARSRQVAHWLAHQGFTEVANFDGGIDAWSRLIDSSVPRY
ncbi:MAG: rhodanese-like domain-containing protein [Pseudomonadota bacterium]